MLVIAGIRTGGEGGADFLPCHLLVVQDGWVFVAAVIAVAIAFGSVLWQTLKAAKTNPAIELKKE